MRVHKRNPNKEQEKLQPEPLQDMLDHPNEQTLSQGEVRALFLFDFTELLGSKWEYLELNILFLW